MYGAHLLGRKFVADDRDWELSRFINAPDDPVAIAMQAVVSDSHAAKTVRAWAQAEYNHIYGPQPAPTPPSPTPPEPTGTDVTWEIDSHLDQGDTGHCVGFGWANWGNSLPVQDSFTNADGDAIYYEAKVIDGEPNQENGSDTRSGAKAMQNRKRLAAYAFAKTVADIETWVRTKGPIVIGSDWTNDMFNPDGDGFVVPTGGVAGGHEYIMSGVLDSEDAYLFENSWGQSFGVNGQFKMRKADFLTLWKNEGDACAAIELPIS